MSRLGEYGDRKGEDWYNYTIISKLMDKNGRTKKKKAGSPHC